MNLRLTPRQKWQRVLSGFALGALIVWSAHISKFEPGMLLGEAGWRNASEALAGFGRPDFSSDFLWRVLHLIAESLAIGMLGMVLAVIMAVPLAAMSACYPNLLDPPGRYRAWRFATTFLRWLARMVLAIMRSIPEIIWAFLFVRIFGLGPGPAVLAIGLTFGGITGKLYADLLEACAPGPIRALRATGNGPISVLLYGLLPQVTVTEQAG
jgi:phosphonate transport system permease protein